MAYLIRILGAQKLLRKTLVLRLCSDSMYDFTGSQSSFIAIIRSYQQNLAGFMVGVNWHYI